MRNRPGARPARLGPLLVLLAFVACAPVDDGGPDGLPAELPVLAIGEPYLEIGTIDGPDEYVFAAIESVVRLGDGSIGVSDAGATRISVYDSAGAFVRRWGSQGEGPEEFRSLARLYPLGTDSVMASERYGGRLAVFDLRGELGRSTDGVEISGDSTFVLDSWLYGRFWIDGALGRDERAATVATIEQLPPPRATPGYRRLRVDRAGGWWVEEPSPASASTETWTRLDSSGRPDAIVRTPRRFTPTWIAGDDVLGVWRGESDVHFVRGYALSETAETGTVPRWLRGLESAVTMEVPPDSAEITATMMAALKSMASAQEIHYSTAFSYTTDLAELERFEKPEGLEVDFVTGTPRGWAVVFTHPSIDRVCGLAYGYDVPPGWTPGMIVCGQTTGRAGDVGGDGADGGA